MLDNLRIYNQIYDYLSKPSFEGGMSSSIEFLQIFLALVSTEYGIPDDWQLEELAYHLNDEQREGLARLLKAANRLTDVQINQGITEEQFFAQQAPRYGLTNPEVMDMPFWTFMVQRRWPAYQARMQFNKAYRDYMAVYSRRTDLKAAGKDESSLPELPSHPGYGPAIWCFKRFGMSHTKLPDGRMLLIAGEHEDYYDVDFNIYSDVIAIDTELQVTIYGYPKKVFEPTDFHTATLVEDNKVYIIGCVGYSDQRRAGGTPVYQLDTTTMSITRIVTKGELPGWISNHQAEFIPERQAIKISGGRILDSQDNQFKSNQHNYWLDLTTMNWSLKAPDLKQTELHENTENE